MNSTAPLIDQFQRRISYLRLSLTDRCDLRCSYCMPERQTFLPRKEVLTLEELHRMALGFIARGVSKIRLTGGEPLVRRDMIELVRALGRKLGDGLEELTLTTNGTQLGPFAEDLREAGVRRVNVSLDTLDREQFARLTRRDSLPQVLEGIAAAQAAGLKVKLNTVALKGVNEHEIAELIGWAHGQRIDLTLIEVMPLGEVDGDRLDHYLPLSEVRADLDRRFTLAPSDHRTGGPARYFDVAETGGRLGLITPLTANFCDGCNRVRVSATGQLYACLGGREQVDLRAALRSDDPDGALSAALDEAMRIKPERHHFAIDRAGQAPALERHMSHTGARMAARLVFLGRLADLAGGGEREVGPGPLEAVLAALPQELAVALLDERIRIALNGELIAERGGIVLGEGDELAFLPPVSGGLSGVIDVRLLTEPFNPGLLIGPFTNSHPGLGGVCTFVGEVRSGEGVEALELSHYAPLTLPGMQALAESAVERFGLLGMLILHRTGVLLPGEPIVCVSAAALHRREAIDAVDYAMDHLKSRSWFWKCEKRGGEWQWIEPRGDDYSAASRWD